MARRRPHDVKTWRAFWALPTTAGPYMMRPDPKTEPEAFAAWEMYWTGWHERRCADLEARYHLGIYYDAREADARLAFFRALPITSSGRWRGQRLNPLAWQEHQWLRPLYGYKKAGGLRLFTDIFVYVPKKQGKSDIAAGIVLDQLFLEDEPGSEVYGAAKTRGQATNVYLRAFGMVKASPPLNNRCTCLESTKRIVVRNPHGADAFYQVLSAEVDAQEGPSMQCISVDEVHVVPAKLLDVLTDGSGAARPQPIRSYTTTAGDDFSLPWFELLQFAKGVEDGITYAAHFLPVLYMARPEEGDDWEDEAVWRRVNPSLGFITEISEMRAKYAEAKAMPHKQASFKRRRLNIPIADEASRYLPMDAWDACDAVGDVTKLAKVRAQMLEDLKGRQAIGWLDLSSVTDITTFGLLFPQPNGDVIPLPWFFLPKDNLDRRGELDHAHYRSWADNGFLELTDGTRNDYREVRKLIQRVREDYKFTDIAYDDWNAGGIETLLTEEDGFTMIPIRQNISTLSQPTKELLGLTLTGQMKHGGNPVLRYMADKFVVKEDQNERVMPLKNKATGRIDGIMGIVFALSRFLRPEPEEEDTPSIYSTRGIITL